MVSPRFAEPQDRAATRASLGLAPADRAVLIVSGSWGVGDVANTFRTIAASDRFVPIVVCGRDERLRERLSHIPGGRALGWTDNMPALMAATDALVENAGGLTAMEALSVGLPIISFRPIAGHGKENTAEMQQAGVSRVARTRHPAPHLPRPGDDSGRRPPGHGRRRAGHVRVRSRPATSNTRRWSGPRAWPIESCSVWWARATIEGDFEPLAGVADRVDFDPAEELRALVARSADVNAEVPANRQADGDARLAPVVPIRAAQGVERQELAPDGTVDAAVVPLRPAGEAGARPARRRPTVRTELAPTGTDGAAPRAQTAASAAIGRSGPNGRPGGGRATHLGRAHLGRGRRHGLRRGVAQPPKQLGQCRLHRRAAGWVAAHRSCDRPAVGGPPRHRGGGRTDGGQGSPADIQHLVSLGSRRRQRRRRAPRLDRQGHRIGQSPWTRANGDVAASHLLAQIAGQPVKVFVPGRRLNAFDLMACYGAHNKTVVPDQILNPADDDPLQHLTARHTYLVNGAKATAQQMQPCCPSCRPCWPRPTCRALRWRTWREAGQPAAPGRRWGDRRRRRHRPRPARGHDLAGAALLGHARPGWRGSRSTMWRSPSTTAPTRRRPRPSWTSWTRLRWRATFFLLGPMVRRAPSLAAELAARGHEIGVHGDEHRSHLHRTPAAIRDDMARARDSIADARPACAGVVPAALWGAVGGKSGVRPPSWACAPCCGPPGVADWRAEATPSTVVADVAEGLRPGATVLLHDSDCTSAPESWRATLGALVPMSDLFARRGLAVGALADHGVRAA